MDGTEWGPEAVPLRVRNPDRGFLSVCLKGTFWRRGGCSGGKGALAAEGVRLSQATPCPCISRVYRQSGQRVRT